MTSTCKSRKDCLSLALCLLQSQILPLTVTMNADQVAEMLSSIRLKEEESAGGNEDDNGDDHRALKKVEAEYERATQYLLKFLASAIKATDGNMEHAIVAGALKALHDHLTSSFWAEHNGTSITITPNLYENSVGVIKRFSRSSGDWILVAKAPEAKIACIIQVKNGWYHLGVYDSSLKPAASGYITREGLEIEGVDLDVTDVQRSSVSFYLLSQDLAERSGLDVGPTFRRYIIKLGDKNERILFKEAYAMAAKYNQSVYVQRNAAADDYDDDDDSEATVDENASTDDSSADNAGDGPNEDSALSEATRSDDSDEESIERRLACIGESQADHLFHSNRRFA